MAKYLFKSTRAVILVSILASAVISLIYNIATHPSHTFLADLGGPSAPTPDKGKAALVVVKNTEGGDGTFDFTSNIAGNLSFSITTSKGQGSYSINNIDVGPGGQLAYTVTEKVPMGWTKTKDTCSSITLFADQTSTCYVTNSKNKTTNPHNACMQHGTVAGDNLVQKCESIAIDGENECANDSDCGGCSLIDGNPKCVTNGLGKLCNSLDGCQNTRLGCSLIGKRCVLLSDFINSPKCTKETSDASPECQ